MRDCIFCQIAHHDIESTILYENDQVIAFKDIDPQAPTHVLIVPKQHIASLVDLKDHQTEILQQLFIAAQHVAAQENIAYSGFRIVLNCNPDGGQTVYHLHAHILGGRKMNWPPG